jgi:leucyl aminopeptidase
MRRNGKPAGELDMARKGTKVDSREGRPIPIHFVTSDGWAEFRKGLAESVNALADLHGFSGQSGRHLLASESGVPFVLFGVDEVDAPGRDTFLAGKLVSLLSKGTYKFANEPPGGHAALFDAALSWAMGSYRFTRYRKVSETLPVLLPPKGIDTKRVNRIASGVALARDLIHTPANDMGPEALEAAALAVAKKYGARAKVIRGDALLRQNFPLIHAVGRAGPQAPRLVDFTWGPARAPKITLVGKGVCFDTGGLDIKPSSAMLMMKKDMAGAATVLGLAQMIMDAKLKVRLRVLLPIVENSVSSNSFRPGDVYRSRKGITVEIGNTDAEGRLILADALALGDDEAPDLICDFATLTGAARVAMGPDLPPFYCTDDVLAADIAEYGMKVCDPVWRLPLWRPYESMLSSKIADTNNVSSGPFAGSITAALFLNKFVGKAKAWAHFDIYAWNPSARPGRPDGAEAQTARLLYELFEASFS